MVAHDSVPGLSRAAAAMPLRLEESRFGDGFFDASGNDMYYIRDWQGNVAAVADGEGNVVQRTGYYPYGMPWRPVGAGSSNRVLFGGKEYHTADGLNEYDFDARRHYPRFPAFTTPDPHADNTPWLSPYVFCAANPVAYVDPSGMDWYKFTEFQFDPEQDQYNEKTSIKYTECKSQEELANSLGLSVSSSQIEYLGNIVVDFKGSMNEKLGKGDNLAGEGAITANVTVYGPNGENDIAEYIGFSMTSNYEKYGAIADGTYDVAYDANGKSGKLKSNYAINSRNPVDCINNINPYPGGYSSTQKNGVFIHGTNQDGFAGGKVSVGCPLILGQQWADFQKQIGCNSFKLILTRQK